MAKLFALFSDESALNRLTQNLGADGYELLLPQPDPQPTVAEPDVPVIAASVSGAHPIGVVVPLADGIAAPTNYERDLEDRGLGEEIRAYADALRNGAHVLIVKNADEALAEQVRQAGASQVSLV